jgi:hypothetical protein
VLEIVPTLEAEIQAERDIVWCGAFDLAWQTLGAQLGAPPRLRDVPDGDPGAKLVAALNASHFDPDSVDPEACLALAGPLTSDWLEAARALVARRFPDDDSATSLLPAAPSPGELIAYARISKSWVFATPFRRLTHAVSFGGASVESFTVGGPFDDRAEYDARARQVLIHDHRFIPDEVYGHGPDDDWDNGPHEPREEFVVELLSKDAADRIVLARCTPRETLGATVDWALSRLRDDVESDPRAHLTRHDRLRVPCIEFDCTRSYAELAGKGIESPNFPLYTFASVRERVKFALDEGGARLVSEGEFRGLSEPPRTIIFDGPFLLVAVRRGNRSPFLALWVETADVLVPSRPGPAT